MFTCETDSAYFTIWRLNGTSYTDLPQKIQYDLNFDQEGAEGNNSALHTLTIKARAVYNGTKVQCVTGDFGGIPVESENVTLTIQGIHILQLYIVYAEV